MGVNPASEEEALLLMLNDRLELYEGEGLDMAPAEYGIC